LMLAPPEVIDSVVVHELCHLKHFDHSPAFYADVLSVLPDYRRSEAWLKTEGRALIARAHN
ncbi:MAG: M48 family metallopeptidase, partial [Oscillospiraceae bacterium]|nr:M48 family metallopeptidase [Oscillospiraceae bacterium]